MACRLPFVRARHTRPRPKQGQADRAPATSIRERSKSVFTTSFTSRRERERASSAPRPRSRIASLLSTAALAAALAGTAQAQVPSVNGQIAYVACSPTGLPSGPATPCDIWVVNADGTGAVNLTDSIDKDENHPAWSPDGTRIAYVELFSGDLMVMNTDGSAKTRITGPAERPTWSPGGTQIAFVRANPGSVISPQWDVMVVDLANGSETVVSRPASFGGQLIEADEIEPAWSPDGGRIAFTGVRMESFIDPATGTPTEGAQYEIVTVNPDGSDELIVSAGAPGSERANFLEEDRAPSWSPDGRMLLFMSQSQAPACCGPWQIWAVNRDGSGATNLTNDATVNDLWPSWSPDGTQIVFQRALPGGRFDLYTMPAPTQLGAGAAAPAPATRLAVAAAGAATPLTNDGNAKEPDWGRNRNAPPPAAPSYSLFVSVADVQGRAGGSVSSSPKGIRCGRDCSQPFATGTQVDLVAAAKRGTTFTGWSGACVGTAPTCRVTMNDVRAVKANFVRSR